MTQDERTSNQSDATQIYVVATDSFMSGWGGHNRSLFAVACPNREVAHEVKKRMDYRTEFKRVRYAQNKPRANGKDHLQIVWFEQFTYQPKMN